MKHSMDREILLERDPHPRSFLRKKIHLTVPACTLLIVIFLSSAFIVALSTLYWGPVTVCYTDNDETSTTKPLASPPKPALHRSKRSSALQPRAIPCFGFGCCTTDLDPSKPWTNSRLPTNIYPIDYQLSLDLFKLNQPEDDYTGIIVIVVEIRSPTSDIILHGMDLSYSEVSVYQHSNPNKTEVPVDCVIPFPATETLVIHLEEQLQVGYLYDVRIEFSRKLTVHGTGLFEIQFDKSPSSIEQTRMILTHFQAVHAREAYPCFDEPGFKTKFQLTVRHENRTRILSNWDEAESFPDAEWIQTEFRTTPPIPTALTAFAVFYNDDLSSRTVTVTHPTTNRNIRINLWARNMYFTNDGGVYISASLEMVRRVFSALLEIFKEIETPIVPTTLNILAVPEYPSDAVSHWGLVIISERALLHNPSTTSALELQRISLFVAKQLAGQWYGNFVSFQWWTDLWLQEALVNYLKYQAVAIAYPRSNIHEQFITEELLSTMLDDSMTTSHPIIKSVSSASQINELYDSIETTKATAIFRMADYYMEKSVNVANNTLFNIVSFLHDREYGFLIPDELLSKYRIGPWRGVDFFDRWLLQSNFPTIFVRFVRNPSDNTYTFQLQQNRYIVTHQYDNDLYPPASTPFGYVWYVPITCSFGNSSDRFTSTRTFFLDQQTTNVSFGSTFYNYFYCNTDFAGYYIMDYTLENWQYLSEALDNNANTQLMPIDRANLLHNAFIDAQSSDESYSVVREVTQFLYRNVYTGLLPWQTLSFHVNRMMDVLEYESLFSVVQKYFRVVVRNYYRTNEAVLWNDVGTFTDEILKQTIVQLACRVELHECIDKVTLLWDEAYSSLVNGQANHSVVDHARAIVYRTHFRNAYNDSEWLTIEGDYHNLVDVQERYRLLQALTQSRQPWHLYQLLYQEAEKNKNRDVDLLEWLTLLARNPVGRELVWSYYRENWFQLQADYKRSNQRLGQLLIDITATFEDEFHENELIDFLASIPGVENNMDARFWALERANMNLWWIIDNADDITNAFDLNT